MVAKTKMVPSSSSLPQNKVDAGLVSNAMGALLKHHEETCASNHTRSDKSQLLGSDLAVQVQISLSRVPENPSAKPIRVMIPHSLHKVVTTDMDEDDEDDVEEPAVCLIVKEESKPWVQEMVAQFPEHMKCVKKVMGLGSLRTKFGRYEQKRELLARYDLFLADDRILPMLAKCLGKNFFKAKKQPIPVRLTRKEALPFAIRNCLTATYMYISPGTCLTIKAGTTAMSTKKLAENVEAITQNAIEKVPRKWANVCSISIKTTQSVALPIYNRTREELAEIAKLAGWNSDDNNDTTAAAKSMEKAPNNEKKRPRDAKATTVGSKTEVEPTPKKTKKAAANKSPLLQALKKQKVVEKEVVADAVEPKKTESSLKKDEPSNVTKSGKKAKKPKQKRAEKEEEEVVVEEAKQEEPKKTPSKKLKTEATVTATAEKSSKKKKNKFNADLEVKATPSKKEVKATPSKKERSDGKKESSDYIASKKFKGAKKGYAFRAGKQGVGYYVDVVPVPNKAAMEALARISSSGGGGSARKGAKRKGRR